MNNRPKLKIVPTKIQRIVDYITLSILILHCGFILMHYNDLPNDIPIHFNAFGNPDSYGVKSSIFILLTINLVIYVGLTILGKFPYLHNYMVNITEENAVFQYSNSIQLLRLLKLIISFLFFYINLCTFRIALGLQIGLGTWFLPIFLITILSTVIYFTYKMLRKN